MLFITEKRNGDIKARKVADVSKQRSYDGYDKSDGSSSAVATDSIFLTGVVDAREGREVAILDIANTFLRAENDERILLFLRGKLTEMMVKIDPSLYRKYVTFSQKGVPMLYARSNIVGTLYLLADLSGGRVLSKFKCIYCLDYIHKGNSNLAHFTGSTYS